MIGEDLTKPDHRADLAANNADLENWKIKLAIPALHFHYKTGHWQCRLSMMYSPLLGGCRIQASTKLANHPPLQGKRVVLVASTA